MFRKACCLCFLITLLAWVHGPSELEFVDVYIITAVWVLLNAQSNGTSDLQQEEGDSTFSGLHVEKGDVLLERTNTKTDNELETQLLRLHIRNKELEELVRSEQEAQGSGNPGISIRGERTKDNATRWANEVSLIAMIPGVDYCYLLARELPITSHTVPPGFGQKEYFVLLLIQVMCSQYYGLIDRALYTIGLKRQVEPLNEAERYGWEALQGPEFTRELLEVGVLQLLIALQEVTEISLAETGELWRWCGSPYSKHETTEKLLSTVAFLGRPGLKALLQLMPDETHPQTAEALTAILNPGQSMDRREVAQEEGVIPDPAAPEEAGVLPVQATNDSGEMELTGSHRCGPWRPLEASNNA